MKKRKILSFVLSLCLLLSCAVTLVACGNKKDDDALRASLSWYETHHDLRKVLKEASNNYTLEVKEITSFDMDSEEVQGAYNTYYKYTPKNVNYSNDTMYKLTLEHDAYLFDAGDKKDRNNKYFSSAGELYLDTTIADLRYNEYEKTDNSWVIKANSHSTSDYPVVEENSAIRDNYAMDIYVGIAFDNAIYDLDNVDDVDAVDAFISYYDKDSKTYIFNSSINTMINKCYYKYFTYYSLEEPTSNRHYFNEGSIDEDTNFWVFNKVEGENYYTTESLFYYYIQNIQMKLDGQKVTALSYDLYLTDGTETSGFRKCGFEKGYHYEFTNIGSSKINLGADIQPSRSSYTGVRPTEEMLTAAKTFFTGGNYTVSYKTDFCRSNNYNMEYEIELKVTDNAISRHMVTYQPASNGNSAQTIIEDIIETKENGIWVQYTRNGGEGGVWHRVEKSANYVIDLQYNAENFWDNLEDAHMTISELDIKGEYSDTLKSYVYSGGEKALMESNGYKAPALNFVSTIGDGKNGENAFTNPVDAMYTFGENGLSSYFVRYGFKYCPQISNPDNAFAEGMLFKTVSNIGTTTITVPETYIASNE